MKRKVVSILQLWLDQMGLSHDDFAELMTSQGYETTGEYVRQVAYGYKRPSWPYAKAMSRATGNVIQADQIMEIVASRDAA